MAEHEIQVRRLEAAAHSEGESVFHRSLVISRQFAVLRDRLQFRQLNWEIDTNDHLF